MRKLIATTALALIIGGPAVAQATQDQTQQPADQQQAGQQQQLQAQDQQQVGQDQQMMAGQGFYQPQPNDIFISELMDAQVYAPAQRDAAVQQDTQQQQQAQPVQPQDQQQQAQPAQQPDQQQADTAAVQQDQQQAEATTDAGAEVEVTVEDAEGETETETLTTQDDAAADTQQTAETQPADADRAEGQVATGTADTTDPQLQEQQSEMQQDQQQLTGQQQAQTDQQRMQDRQMVGQQLHTRQVTQQDLEQYENIGQVSDIIVDEQGQFRAVVLDVGGFLGIGAREVALDAGQVEFARDQEQPDQLYIISHAGTDELEQAPEFDRAQLDEQRQQQAAVQQPADQQPADQQQVATQQAQPQQQDQVAAQPGAQQDQWRGDRQALAAPQMQREGFQQAEAAEITADNLIGANVYDVNDENIGSVSDIVMNPEGQAEYAVIDVGGFLGFGTHTVAIGFDEMQVLHDEGWADLRVYVDVTQEQLENMPEYQQN